MQIESQKIAQKPQHFGLQLGNICGLRNNNVPRDSFKRKYTYTELKESSETHRLSKIGKKIFKTRGLGFFKNLAKLESNKR